jgi:hypothetical protein
VRVGAAAPQGRRRQFGLNILDPEPEPLQVSAICRPVSIQQAGTDVEQHADGGAHERCPKPQWRVRHHRQACKRKQPGRGSDLPEASSSESQKHECSRAEAGGDGDHDLRNVHLNPFVAPE